MAADKIKLVDKIKTFFKPGTDLADVKFQHVPAPVSPKIEALLGGGGFSGRNNIYSFSYSGEKNLGEMGPPIDYALDYDLLRIRSWQSQLESDVCQTVIKRYITWKIGEGLKLQAEPSISVLRMEGIDIDKEKWSSAVEAYYDVYKRSKKSDYSEMRKFDLNMKRVERNAIIGGDVLLVQRFDGKNLSIQVIDGAHVKSPGLGSECLPAILANGNRIINGIEVDPKGKHVAYYVQSYQYGSINLKSERIEAYSKTTGLPVAFLHYGSEHRLDNIRGLPLLAACLETAKKMERYKEAVLGSAEEIAKIVYQVVHQIYSDGSNPALDRMAKASGFSTDKGEIGRDALGQAVADTVAMTTNKTAINMPIGAELKSVENKAPLTFSEFYSVNIKLLCATVGIPYAVAMSDYDGSYSSSRAAIKDWEHSLNVDRNEFASSVYQKNYEMWLHIMILRNKIQAPGYLEAWKNQDEIVLCAYRRTRWIGAQVPHIDPLKEVAAERLKLGDGASMIPLSTIESSSERLGGGESQAIMEQYAKEIEFAKSVGINTEPIQKAQSDTNKKEGE